MHLHQLQKKIQKHNVNKAREILETCQKLKMIKFTSQKLILSITFNHLKLFILLLQISS